MRPGPGNSEGGGKSADSHVNLVRVNFVLTLGAAS
jgi:hypothetical protein